MSYELKSLDYWIDISECVCDSPTPIGACLKCDLIEVREKLKSLQDMSIEDITEDTIEDSEVYDEDQERCAKCGSLVCICYDDYLGPGWAAHCRKCSETMIYKHQTKKDAADWWNKLQKNSN